MRWSICAAIVLAACSPSAPATDIALSASPAAATSAAEPSRNAWPSGVFVTNLVPYGEPGGLQLSLPAEWGARWIEKDNDPIFVSQALDNSGAVSLIHYHYQSENLGGFLEKEQNIVDHLVGVEGLTRSNVKLSVGDAVLFRYLRISPRRELASVYVFGRGTEIYTLTFASLPESTDRLQVVFAAILASLSWS